VSITAARLQAEVGADTKGFDSGMAHADRTIKSAPGKWATALKVGAGAALAVGGALVVRGIAGAIRSGLDSLAEQGVVVAQTNAVIRSTGAAANVTAAQIRDLSNAIETKTTIDDKAVQAGANMLLTFTNVRNEAGAGNDIFNQSLGILADMSTAMGTDMKGGAIQLGKALNDPLKGITALTRVGVTFDAQQKKRIAAYMKEGKVAEAQKIILRELNKEFGGSGAAFAATDAGKAAAFQDAIEGVQQALTGALLPALTRVRVGLTEFLGKPETLAQVGALGDAIGSIFSPGNLSMAANLMTTAAGAIGTAIKLFSALPPEVQALAVGALALKKITGIGPTDIVKSVLGGLDLFKRGGTPANPLFVADVAGGIGGKGVIPGGGKGLMSTLTSAPVLIGGAVIAASLAAVWQGKIMPGLQEQAGANNDATTKLLTTGTLSELRGALAGLEGMPDKLDPLQKVLYELNASGVKTHTEALEQAIRDEISSREKRPLTPAEIAVDKQGANWDPGRPRGEHAGTVSNADRAVILQRITAKTGITPDAARVTAVLEKNRRASDTASASEARRIATLTSVARAGAAASRDAAAAIRSKDFSPTYKPTIIIRNGFTIRNSVRNQRVATAVSTRYSGGARIYEP